MKFSKKILSQTVTQLCLAHSVKHIVISPGSRNAPLSIGFTQHPDFKNYSIVDERCAAFFALGMAQQLQQPVALVCTSGSALLNYYPAVAEAFYSDIPLVIISADRPSHLIDTGDGQTIRQENVYANHILYAANCKEGDEHQDANEAEISKALRIAMIQKGPVHINVPFSEPLYEMTNTLEISLKELHSIPTSENTSLEMASDKMEVFIQHWNQAKRKMVLVGVLEPNSVEQEYINLLASDESVVVCTETTSNLHHESFFPAIDQLIAPLDDIDFQKLQPEVLLTFGGMVVSKKIKAFLRSYAPNYHYHVDAKKAYDTFFSLSHHFQQEINPFFKSLSSDLKLIKSTHQKYWLTIKTQRLNAHDRYIKRIPFSDFNVFSDVFLSLPKGIQLQLANSATVRYAQLYDLDKSIYVYCNRGTSGIDGSTSTAIGAAHIASRQTVFVTGDLSFFYDSNALWNTYIPKSFRIILINNSGGGIFRILPDAQKATYFEEFFETRHGLTAVQLSAMFGFDYESAQDEIALRDALEGFYQASEKPKLLEVFTPPEINDTILKDYFKFIGDA